MGRSEVYVLVIILGLGFTGQRLARRLLAQGIEVYAAVRGVERFRALAEAGLNLCEMTSRFSMPRNGLLVHLVPPLVPPENERLRAIVESFAPTRIVYVSSTGVFGDQIEVDEQTQAKPSDERGRLRLEEERWIESGPWSSLILRSAAIYGPGRGVHAAIRAGKPPRSSGSGIVSRIHVDDLVEIVKAGMFSAVGGRWPVADDDPCSSGEIAAWCAKFLDIDEGTLPANGVTIPGRRVNGAKIRELLDIKLAHPSWRTGVPASLAEEETTAND